MSNTLKRIISALILLGILIMAIYFGPQACIGFAFIIGVLIVDEIFCNFFKEKRFSAKYFLAEGILILPFIFINFFYKNFKIQEFFIYAALAADIILVFYLFCTDMKSTFFMNIGKKYPFLSGLFVLLPLISLTSIVSHQDWQILLGALLIVTFGMDTGAWFFGKKFGKHKLWPEVSPKKTFEGLVGGMLTAGLAGGLFWSHFMGHKTPQLFFLFIFLGFTSQIGDLIQSKLKRQFKLKDSSSLIPGHGGVYDRVDSLIFVSPFYATALRFIYF